MGNFPKLFVGLPEGISTIDHPYLNHRFSIRKTYINTINPYKSHKIALNYNLPMVFLWFSSGFPEVFARKTSPTSLTESEVCAQQLLCKVGWCHSSTYGYTCGIMYLYIYIYVNVYVYTCTYITCMTSYDNQYSHIYIYVSIIIIIC